MAKKLKFPGGDTVSLRNNGRNTLIIDRIGCVIPGGTIDVPASSVKAIQAMAPNLEVVPAAKEPDHPAVKPEPNTGFTG